MEDLTAKENELLRKNLEFYDSLDSGERTPVTKSQKQFVRVCKGLEEAKTDDEIAYEKYKKAFRFKTVRMKIVKPRSPRKPAIDPKIEVAKRNFSSYE